MEQTGRFRSKIVKFASTFFLLVVLPTLVFVGLQVVRARKKAAVEGGEFRVSLSPATGSFKVNQSFPVAVKFDLGKNPVFIAAISVRLTYSYSGSSPSLVVVDADPQKEGIQIEPGQEFRGSDWRCPVNKVEHGQGRATVDFSCANTSLTGYKTDRAVTLATITFKAAEVPAVNPVELSFDATESIITRKSDGQDFLAIPESKGSYTIEGSQCGLGDVNCDGKVDDYDLAVVLRKWGQKVDIDDADFNDDEVIDDGDLSILLSHWTG